MKTQEFIRNGVFELIKKHDLNLIENQSDHIFKIAPKQAFTKEVVLDFTILCNGNTNEDTNPYHFIYEYKGTDILEVGVNYKKWKSDRIIIPK